MSSATLFSRREALTLMLRYGAALSALPGLGRLAAAASASGTPGEVRDVAALIRELVPHAGLDADFYLAVAGQVVRRVTASAETRRLLARGLARLETSGAGESPAATAAATREAIEDLESDPFFTLVRTAAVEVIYRDPRAWEIVGYGGNALARGGYLRDFNDIDWLPGGDER